MKLFATLFTLLHLFACYYASANVCNASFTYQQVNTSVWQFKSSQSQQPGITYYHTWKSNGALASNAEIYTRSFSGSGTYNICHIVSIQDSAGNTVCVDTSCQAVTISIPVVPPLCIPQFNILNYVNNLTVNYSLNLLSYTNLKIEWDFYDNNGLVTSAAPSYTYTSYGSKMVKVYVTDTIQQCIDSTMISISISAPEQCAIYIHSITTSQSSLSIAEIEFHVAIEGNYNNVLWTYGDAQYAITNDTVHQYALFSSYGYCLTISDTLTGCSASYCDYVSIDTCRSIYEKFTAYTGWQDFKVNLGLNTPGSTTPLYWSWNFDDGTTDNTSLSPAHIYNAPGDYNVCLTGKYNGCAEFTYCDTVAVQCFSYLSIASSPTSSNAVLFNTNADNKPNVKYNWQFGDGAIGVGRTPTHIYAQSGYYEVCLIAVDTLFGCSDTICSPTLVKQWNDTICGYAFVDANANGIFDPTENPLQAVNVRCYISSDLILNSPTDSTGYYMHIVPYSTYFYIALQYPNSNSSTFTLGSNYGYTFTAPGLINCGFNFGVNTSLAQVSGNIFADENSNGIREGSEQRLPYELVKVGNYFTTTNSIGNYSINVPVGYYSITKPSTGLYAGKPILPTQLTVNATTPGALYNNNNFGIGIPATYKDIAIDVIPTSTISATRLATYQVQISNLANNLAYYQADILNDSVLDYFFAHYPNIDNYNANNDVATWYGHLIRFQRRIIPIGYTVSASATINQALRNVGSVALQLDTDQNLSNDTARTQQVVISSYDPNNKVPGNCGETERGYILAGDKMQYTINFQNTGNDVAVNIVLKDVISPNLDINSLRFIATSHVNNFSLRVDGDTVYFIYKSIMLPDSLSNESASKGWVSFSIQQKPNLTVGSEIKNTAAIYFDYNEAVITNTTLHTIASYLSISEAYEDVKLNIYPNPTNDKVMVEVPSNMFGTKMHVTDMLGRHILSKEVDTPTETVSVSDLPSGIYIVSLDGNGRLLQSKLVIE